MGYEDHIIKLMFTEKKTIYLIEKYKYSRRH